MQDAGRDPRAPDRLSGVGRFAPSPSGPLHAGSLVAVLACHASIRSRGGRFTVRVDDLDTAREVPGARASILASLRAFGFVDTGTPLLHQSSRLPEYRQALRGLTRAGLVFRCRCSRRTLAAHPVYPGTCRRRRLSLDELDERLDAGTANESLRVHLQGAQRFVDEVQGEQHVVLERDVGDIAVLRRDGVIAWPLATACDDSDEVSEVVRGADLLAPTSAQIGLMQRLGRRAPRYAHVPVLCDEQERKLGKQTGAPALPARDALPLLHKAWAFLGQAPFAATDVAGFHAGTPARWRTECVPGIAQRYDPHLAG